MLLLSARLVRLRPSVGVAADPAPPLVDLVVLHSEAPAVEGAVLIVPLQPALGPHLADGWSARGLEEDGVTTDMGYHGQTDGECTDQPHPEWCSKD